MFTIDPYRVRLQSIFLEKNIRAGNHEGLPCSFNIVKEQSCHWIRLKIDPSTSKRPNKTDKFKDEELCYMTVPFDSLKNFDYKKLTFGGKQASKLSPKVKRYFKVFAKVNLEKLLLFWEKGILNEYEKDWKYSIEGEIEKESKIYDLGV